MDIERTDLAMYVYNVALVMSGAFLVAELGIEDPLVMGGMAVVVGLLWSVYYRLSMAPRLEAMRQGVFIPDDEEFTDKGKDEGGDADEQPPESDEERHGSKAPWEE
jgi:hypothetical protein